MKIEFEPKRVGEVSGRIIKSRYTPDGSYPKRGRELPKPKTVGQLKEFLSLLPDKLPVGDLSRKGVQPVWFNIGYRSEHLAFEEPD